MPGSRTQASPANTSKSIGQDILDGLRYWLPKLADPATSPIAQATAPLQAVITPGLIPASYALDKLMQTRFGKEAVAALDALPPGENLADDGLRAMASIGPLTVAQLNRVNRMRQGSTAKPTDYFHSKVADAVDNWAKGFRDPSKPVGANVFEQLFNKLKNSGFNKKELEHFDFPKALEDDIDVRDMFNKSPQSLNDIAQEISPLITVQENSQAAMSPKVLDLINRGIIKPEHKSGGLSGHTDSFWSMLSALGLGGLAEMTKRKLANQQQE